MFTRFNRNFTSSFLVNNPPYTCWYYTYSPSLYVRSAVSPLSLSDSPPWPSKMAARGSQRRRGGRGGGKGKEGGGTELGAGLQFLVFCFGAYWNNMKWKKHWKASTDDISRELYRKKTMRLLHTFSKKKRFQKHIQVFRADSLLLLPSGREREREGERELNWYCGPPRCEREREKGGKRKGRRHTGGRCGGEEMELRRKRREEEEEDYRRDRQWL